MHLLLVSRITIPLDISEEALDTLVHRLGDFVVRDEASAVVLCRNLYELLRGHRGLAVLTK